MEKPTYEWDRTKDGGGSEATTSDPKWHDVSKWCYGRDSYGVLMALMGGHHIDNDGAKDLTYVDRIHVFLASNIIELFSFQQVFL